MMLFKIDKIGPNKNIDIMTNRIELTIPRQNETSDWDEKFTITVNHQGLVINKHTDLSSELWTHPKAENEIVIN